MAQFKTAHDQYILPLDVAVIGTVSAPTRKQAIQYGDFVVLTPAASGNPAYIKKATTAQVTGKQATHIVALTDQVFEGVDTAAGKYAYDPIVAATGTTIGASVPVKRVGLYPIFDWADVIPDADANDVVS